MMRITLAPSVLWIVSLLVCVADASAAPKLISELFPSLPNPPDLTAIYDTNSVEYYQFHQCRTSTNPTNPCGLPGSPIQTPRLYIFNQTPSLDDSFDIVNRCMGIRVGKRYNAGPLVINSAAGTVDCPGIGPEEVVSAHILFCYGKSVGGACSYASACFAGAKVLDRCTKDYVAEDVFLPNGATGAGTPICPPGQYRNGSSACTSGCIAMDDCTVVVPSAFCHLRTLLPINEANGATVAVGGRFVSTNSPDTCPVTLGYLCSATGISAAPACLNP
jgi:hypothetical protein